ncbi:MAG: MerR family transcriptional regulator [Gemmatimonadales bacterium]
MAPHTRSAVRPEPNRTRRAPLVPVDPAGGGLTVQETAERTGLSEHTLRYYERAGLLSRVRRDGSSGHRRYSADDVSRISTLACLRATGMPLDQMRRYFKLAARGRGAAHSLRALLEEQACELEDRMRAMQGHREYVRRKIDYWKAVEAGQDTAAQAIADELSCQVFTS